jgi:hypothetical protein
MAVRRGPSLARVGMVICITGMQGICTTACAKEVAQVVGRSEAVVVERLSLVKVEDLEFGKIVAGGTAGTITISPDGSRAANGGALGVSTGFHPAAFAGYGFRNQNLLISVGSNSPIISRVGGSETMRFDTFTIGSVPPTTLSTVPRTFRINSTSGMFAFTVGATLRVNARQAPGIYQGTFSITVSYL